MNLNTSGLRRRVTSVLVASALCLSSGCATLAHSSSLSSHRRQTTSSCAGQGDVCPWLVGDALLLLPGLLPGVIAFIVDFSSGAWHHDEYVTTVLPTDELADASTPK